MSQFLEKPSDPPVPLDERLYAELKKVAAACLRGERSDHTLAPTDLLHEACLRLRLTSPSESRSPVDLRRLAARTMRHILVDHARQRSAVKRDAGRLDSRGLEAQSAVARDKYIVELDGALAALAEFDEELVAVVELLFFGGCTVDETAIALSLSPRTVKRRWSLAKGWLHREITNDATR